MIKILQNDFVALYAVDFSAKEFVLRTRYVTIVPMDYVQRDVRSDAACVPFTFSTFSKLTSRSCDDYVANVFNRTAQ